MIKESSNKRSAPVAGKISVIIINYNGGEYILECIRSLKKQTYKNQEIIVVDNLSTDGSVAAIESEFQDVILIKNQQNLGWGVGCNIGINAADGQYLAILNNDLYLDNHCLEEMVNGIELDKSYGSCASKVLLRNEQQKIEAAGIVIYRDGMSVGRGRFESSQMYNEVEEVFCACDCCCLYRREMIDDIGLYDPDFFLYADETDIGWRHQIAGWKCIYYPKAISYHVHSASSGCYSDFKAYHVERNRIFLCFKYFPLWYLFSSFVFSLYRYFLQIWDMRDGRGALAKYLENTTLLHGAKILVKAHIDAFLKMPVMLRRRFEYNSIKRLSNKEIAGLFKKFGFPARKFSLYE